MVDLGTTNWLLGIMAVTSVLEALVIVGMMIVGYRLYRDTRQLIGELEARHVAPLRQQVDGILADVQSITRRVSEQTERMDQAITGTIDRVDETAERMKTTVRDKVSRATGIVRGIRAVIVSLLTNDSPAEGRV